jgi:hypothetical protein
LSLTESAANDEAVSRAIVLRLLNGGSRVTEDARWVVNILPEDLQSFFRCEVLAELERKAARTDGTVDRVKLRKLFYALSQTSKAIFGPEYSSTKKKLDAELRAAVRKTVAILL